MRHRLYVVIHHGAWAGIVAHACFIPLFSLLDVGVMALFNVGSVVLWSWAWWLNRRRHHDLSMFVIAFEVLAHAICAVSLLGWASGFQYYVLPLVPFVTFNERASLRSTLALATFVIAFLALLHALVGERELALEPFTWQVLHGVNLAVPVVVLAVSSYYYRVASLEAEQRLASLAAHDPLTGLLNRRRMLERLRERQGEFERQRRPFVLVMADIDHFKEVNDTYGHDVGDQVLCEVARRLRADLRKGDVLARWGGEEFLLLLSEATEEGASAVAEKLRLAMREPAFELPAGRLTVSMTFGLHLFDGECTLEQAIALADAALYAGKAAGRNRIAWSRGSAPPTSRAVPSSRGTVQP